MQNEQEFRQIIERIDEVTRALLQVRDYKAEAIDLNGADAPLKLLARTWRDTQLPSQSDEKLANMIRQRLEETLSPILWIATGQIVSGALEYATRETGATVMPTFDGLSRVGIAEQPYSEDEEEVWLIGLAERIRIKGTLQVSLNWGEIESILDDFFGSSLSACKTEQEAKTAWNSFLKKEQKHLKKRMGDSPVEKIVETNRKVEMLTDKQREQMRSDLVKLASQNFKLNIDHVIRCAIAANLFLSLVYWEYAFDREKGRAEKEVQQSLPGVEELRDIIGKRLNDWLIQPLPKRPRLGKQAKADLSQLRQFYEEVIGDWRDAFSFCREALNSRSATRRATWKEDLKKYYPSLRDYDDLIERLQPIENWPEQVAAKCSEQGGEDKPEDIAYEHAARLCDAANYTYKLSSLIEEYRKQGRQKKEEKE
ncbi:MAG TPA: hypothetical protein PLD20_33365 [Blastocatellia bacterium]|nr:hypothetical protein [Blastocatellia bacterium]HMX24850.1 hypothetical protein [Blastocatellia bacterium]HMY70888.1 hypothetical protein [Blastocatellia bacterium]HMZ22863.1 hypothetical protein [Blastocatellia bacterium]HNG29983.1 hypothetical protein [Blastocatellia bacterium]